VSFDYPHHFFLGALTGMLPLCGVGAYWLALLRLGRGMRFRSAWRATAGLLTLFCVATFWLLGEEVAFTVQRFGPGYRLQSWADIGWMADTIFQEPAIIPVGALLIIALSAGTLACAVFTSRRWPAVSPLSPPPSDTAIPTLVIDMGLVFSVTTLLIIAQDLLVSQINFTAVVLDSQTGQSTLLGAMLGVVSFLAFLAFLAFPAALMVSASWHARRIAP